MTFTLKRFAGKALLSGGATLIGLGLASGTAQAFNPQPDPPGRQANVVVNQPAGSAEQAGDHRRQPADARARRRARRPSVN